LLTIGSHSFLLETAPSDESEQKEQEADVTATTATGDNAATPNGNSTPAKTPIPRRKSTAGGSSAKKLNKKKSHQRITHLDAQPGEYYIARLKSYPPWPAVICDEEMLPQTLLSTRPVTTKQADGTYKEAYADGGKRVNERTFPIMFLETNELYVFSNVHVSYFIGTYLPARFSFIPFLWIFYLHHRDNNGELQEANQVVLSTVPGFPTRISHPSIPSRVKMFPRKASRRT
jgi:hypothetical protein